MKLNRQCKKVLPQIESENPVIACTQFARLSSWLKRGIFKIPRTVNYLIPLSLAFHMRKLICRFGYWNDATYFHTHSNGLFSNFSTIFYEVARMHPRAKKVDLSSSFTHFKDETNSDCWQEYFQPICNHNQPIQFRSFSKELHHHADYTTLNFEEAQRGLEYYFKPSDHVNAQVLQFVQKYHINFEKTICICFRGTDKHTEIATVSPLEFRQAAKSIIEQNPDFKIFIQTDQSQVREMMMAEFDTRAFFISEIPVTSGRTVMHLASDSGGLDFGIKFFAVTLIMARCKYLITHTGNVAYWSVLYRGNADRVIQFKGALA